MAEAADVTIDERGRDAHRGHWSAKLGTPLPSTGAPPGVDVRHRDVRRVKRPVVPRRHLRELRTAAVRRCAGDRLADRLRPWQRRPGGAPIRAGPFRHHRAAGPFHAVAAGRDAGQPAVPAPARPPATGRRLERLPGLPARRRSRRGPLVRAAAPSRTNRRRGRFCTPRASLDRRHGGPLARLTEDLVESAYDERGAYEWLLAARSRLGLDSLTADAVTPELRSLLTQLTDLRVRLERGEALTLADPHARAGDLIAALLDDTEDRDRVTSSPPTPTTGSPASPAAASCWRA